MIGTRIMSRAEVEADVRAALHAVISKQIEAVCDSLYRFDETHDATTAKNTEMAFSVASELLEEFRSGGPKATAKPAKGDE